MLIMLQRSAFMQMLLALLNISPGAFIIIYHNCYNIIMLLNKRNILKEIQRSVLSASLSAVLSIVSWMYILKK